MMLNVLCPRGRASLPSKRLRLLACAGPALLLAAAGAGNALGQTTAPPRFRITGIVVNAIDGAPLRRCRLAATLGPAARGQDRQPVEVQSDERGRFDLEVKSAGSWRLTASGRNLHQQSYEGHEGFFTGIVLTTAQPAVSVIFKAMPDGFVSGLVIDEAGEAVRNAPVSLILSDPSVQQTAAGQNARTQQTMTDDRGRYEFSGLDTGAYLVNVRARPWYAPTGGSAGAGLPSLDPSLDVVYPVTWYPGTTDDASATPLTVRAGERAEADFHLTPIPSAHLRLPLPADPGSAGSEGRGLRSPAQVVLLMPKGGTQPVSGNFSTSASGEIDLGGLAPGTYQVTLPGSRGGDPGHTTVLRIAGGGTITEVGSGVADSTLTISVDGGTGVEASRVLLTDTLTRRVVRPGNGRGRPEGFNPSPGSPRGSGPERTNGIGAITGSASQHEPTGAEALRTLPQTSGAEKGPRPAIRVELPAGRYEVSVAGNSGVFVTGLTGKGAETEGRFLTVREASASLVVHLAAGLATVEGTASLGDKPCPGALVLLVPATFGTPGGLATVHRDQSNTDGSFRLTGVVPGQYILVAIDRGWGVRWNDPATLQKYLVHGTPLDLTSSVPVRSSLEAVAP